MTTKKTTKSAKARVSKPAKGTKAKPAVAKKEKQMAAKKSPVVVAKKAKAPPPASDPAPSSECLKEGSHEWTDEGAESYCAKCQEPAPAKVAKQKGTAKAKPVTKSATERPAKKLSAIDAAAKLLAETKQPLNCKQLIEAIAAKGYWTSPSGKTPQATLYSAILRELQTEGKAARFVKIERGQFATNPQ